MFQKPAKEIALAQKRGQYNGRDADTIETVVGPSVVVEGDFSSDGKILVKGTVSGNVKTSHLLTVEEGAKILANVRAGSAHVAGSVKGNMWINDLLELTSTSQILGDVHCKTLVVEAGARIHGKVVMKEVEIEGLPKSAKDEKRNDVIDDAEGEEPIKKAVK